MADSTVLRRHCGPQGGVHCAWTRTMRHAASSSSSVHLVVPNFYCTHVAVVAAHQTRQPHAGALRPPLARSRVVSAPHTGLARTCLQPARTHTCMCERCSSCVLVTAGPLHTCVSEHLPALTHMHAVAMHGTCHMAGRVGCIQSCWSIHHRAHECAHESNHILVLLQFFTGSCAVIFHSCERSRENCREWVTAQGRRPRQHERQRQVIKF